ncbi:hypothetical protein KDI_02060 [Dictyobacter arantiisoli]|uniref:Uncharacterized protein n=1 Tax=Dictyobacter arantiisoli TaxID=2014874 RepID=A0A5A5T5K3_9CHLR|nr:hypothetical protein KDI_02060 [Dictyobacter arantiisoli]
MAVRIQANAQVNTISCTAYTAVVDCRDRIDESQRTSLLQGEFVDLASSKMLYPHVLRIEIALHERI